MIFNNFHGLPHQWLIILCDDCFAASFDSYALRRPVLEELIQILVCVGLDIFSVTDPDCLPFLGSYYVTMLKGILTRGPIVKREVPAKDHRVKRSQESDQLLARNCGIIAQLNQVLIVYLLRFDSHIQSYVVSGLLVIVQILFVLF